MPSLYIIGVGGHARSVADVAMSNESDIQITFVHETARAGEIIMGRSALRSFDVIRDSRLIIAVGNNADRAFRFHEFSDANIVSVVSKKAYMGFCSSIGRGCFLGDNAHIGPGAVVGDNCIINTGAIVEHECVVGSHTHVSVGAKVCGRSRIGQRCMIGAGATVIDKVSICDDVVVGAGAVVVEDITEKGTYVGVPARMKENTKAFVKELGEGR